MALPNYTRDIFEVAKIANFTREERFEYEESLKNYRDYQNTLDAAKEEGRVEGIEEGMEKGRIKEKIETVRNCKSLGLPVETIVQITGLSIDEINKL